MISKKDRETSLAIVFRYEVYASPLPHLTRVCSLLFFLFTHLFLVRDTNNGITISRVLFQFRSAPGTVSASRTGFGSEKRGVIFLRGSSLSPRCERE